MGELAFSVSSARGIQFNLPSRYKKWYAHASSILLNWDFLDHKGLKGFEYS